MEVTIFWSCQSINIPLSLLGNILEVKCILRVSPSATFNLRAWKPQVVMVEVFCIDQQYCTCLKQNFSTEHPKQHILGIT